MIETLALIGYGEAGRTFARAARWKGAVQVFDIKTRDDAKAAAMRARYEEDAVAARDSLSCAVEGAAAILSTVTADQALTVADEAASNLRDGAFYFDMNSVAPETKRAAARTIDAAGGRYVDVAIMAPVNPQRLAVPLLVSGPHAADGETVLRVLGFTNVRAVGDDVGRASTIKMLRSVMYKGVEALTAECLIACERAGVTDEVLASFGADWASGADYRLDRMLVHGARRSAEMHESSRTLESLGVAPMLTRGTVDWQQAIGDLGIAPVPDGLAAKLSAILERLP